MFVLIDDRSFISESAKAKSKSSAEVNMEELVGNTQGFAESGSVLVFL